MNFVFLLSCRVGWQEADRAGRGTSTPEDSELVISTQKIPVLGDRNSPEDRCPFICLTQNQHS